MGRVKELLEMIQEIEMIKSGNNNISEYLLTMEYENKVLKYFLLDLRSMETMIINEKIPETKLNQEIPKQLAIIIHETYYHVKTYDRLNYNELITNGWINEKYLFEGIVLNESINSLNDLLILPSSEKAIIFYLSEINNHLDNISISLEEQRGDIENNLYNIKKELDLMNYLTQH